MRRWAEGGASDQGFDGEEVEGVLGNEVYGEDVDVLLGVGGSASGPAALGFYVVGGFRIEHLTGFDLHPEKVAVVVDDAIVTGLFAEGPGDTVAVKNCAIEEGGFADFAAIVCGAHA